jgi:hypothetical protein
MPHDFILQCITISIRLEQRNIKKIKPSFYRGGTSTRYKCSPSTSEGGRHICTGPRLHLVQILYHICTGCFVSVQYPVKTRVMNQYKLRLDILSPCQMLENKFSPNHLFSSIDVRSNGWVGRAAILFLLLIRIDWYLHPSQSLFRIRPTDPLNLSTHQKWLRSTLFSTTFPKQEPLSKGKRLDLSKVDLVVSFSYFFFWNLAFFGLRIFSKKTISWAFKRKKSEWSQARQKLFCITQCSSIGYFLHKTNTFFC